MRFSLQTSSVTKAGPSHCIVANAVPHPIGDSRHQTGSTLISKVKEAEEQASALLSHLEGRI